jgi:hypothetical protein
MEPTHHFHKSPSLVSIHSIPHHLVSLKSPNFTGTLSWKPTAQLIKKLPFFTEGKIYLLQEFKIIFPFFLLLLALKEGMGYILKIVSETGSCYNTESTMLLFFISLLHVHFSFSECIFLLQLHVQFLCYLDTQHCVIKLQISAQNT